MEVNIESDVIYAEPNLNLWQLIQKKMGKEIFEAGFIKKPSKEDSVLSVSPSPNDQKKT